MNTMDRKISMIFKNKNNILFFFLSLIISLLATISLSVNSFLVEKWNSDFKSFPTNYSYYFGPEVDSEEKMSRLFPGLEYTTLISPNSELDFSLELSNTRFVIVGVDNDFMNYPLPNFNNNIFLTSLQQANLVSGETFTDDDIIAETKTIMMNECYLKACNYNGEDIYIEGELFKLKGVLDNPQTYIKYAGTDTLLAPVYMPYSTLKKLLGSNGYYQYTAIVKTNGARFKDLEGENQRIITKYMLDKEKSDNYEEMSKQTFTIVLSLTLLAVAATFIVQYIMIRNRHSEIGIKRAIGATKTDIVYEFAFEFVLVTTIAIILGFAIGSVTMLLYELKYCFLYNAALMCINFVDILSFLAIYYLLIFISAISSITIGANVNISSIITEER